MLADGAAVPLDGNIMMVAEAEFAFTFARALPRRENPYTQDEVLGAVESLHPAIEVPDSRYNDFATVGAPQLIADTACADWFVLGAPTAADWRSRDLASHVVAAFRNGEKVATGSGANVLGDPRIALAWLVNELRTYADGISAGQFVTTGTCVIPVPIQRGDKIRVDFGEFGTRERTRLASRRSHSCARGTMVDVGVRLVHDPHSLRRALSQMYTRGPATSFATSSSLRRQKEHASLRLNITPSLIPVSMRLRVDEITDLGRAFPVEANQILRLRSGRTELSQHGRHLASMIRRVVDDVLQHVSEHRLHLLAV